MITPVEQLKAIKELLEKGSISISEYESLKQKIIGGNNNTTDPVPSEVKPGEESSQSKPQYGSKNKLILIAGLLLFILVVILLFTRDTDGDGVGNFSDACPDVAGLAHCSGCPDIDNDSIGDQEDKCPDEPGLVINNGCPDSDQDGVVDQLDNCPAIAGTGPNGCMVLDGSQSMDDRITEIRNWFKDAENSLDERPIGRSESFMEEAEGMDYLQHVVSYELTSQDQVYLVKKQGANGYEETIKFYFRHHNLYFIYGKGNSQVERFEYRSYFTREGYPLKVQVNKGPAFMDKLPKETYFDQATCKKLIKKYISTLNLIQNALKQSHEDRY